MYVVVMNCSSECAYGYYHYVGIVIGVCVCVCHFAERVHHYYVCNCGCGEGSGWVMELLGFYTSGLVFIQLMFLVCRLISDEMSSGTYETDWSLGWLEFGHGMDVPTHI